LPKGATKRRKYTAHPKKKGKVPNQDTARCKVKKKKKPETSGPFETTRKKKISTRRRERAKHLKHLVFFLKNLDDGDSLLKGERASSEYGDRPRGPKPWPG